MNKHQAKKLISKYNQGTVTPEERILVEQWFLKDLESNYYTPSQKRMEEAGQRIKIALVKHINQAAPVKTIKLWPRIAAAASIVIGLSIGGYFIVRQSNPVKQTALIQKPDITPGHNQATLTLAGGQKILLTKGLKGKLAQQGSTLIRINSAGGVAYQAGRPDDQVKYNTLSTANGEQSPYPLVLADGTKVWLNAASSITFPTAFSGKSREVKVNGEAYFEVAHNAARPFRVSSNGQTVEVLGTHFNINAYSDEPAMKTTLFTGSVRISKDGKNALLKPGEQSVIQTGSSVILVKAANMEETIAWKNGLFNFNNTNIEVVMRQLSRWYNVKVVYPDGVPNTVFTGDMYRNVNASQVLEVLSFFKVHFRIEQGTIGKKIIVLP